MLDKIKVKLQAIPKRRWWLYIGAAVFALVYLLWCRYSPQPIKPGQVIESAPPPKAVANEPKKTIATKVQVYREPERVTRKLDLPSPKPKEEVQAAADIPKLKNGGTAAVFLNTSTGQTRVEIKAKETPWFQFERNNALGLEVGIGFHGRYFQGDYRRDIFSIKRVTVTGRVGVISFPDRTDMQAGIRAEYRW